MTGFLRFVGKEASETVRTWRLFVLPGVVLLFAVTSPILAELTPALLRSVGEGQAGVVIQVPDPTWRDAYLQWVKNLSQMVTLALLIVSAGLIAGERASGTAVLVLSKPVSRTGFVSAKYLTQLAFVAALAVAGAGIVWAVTLAVFGQAPVAPLAEATALWLALAAFLLAATVFFSAWLSTLAAAGLAVLTYAALGVAALWGPLARYSPAGLTGLVGDAISTQGAGDVLWPVASALGGAVALVGLAALVFRGQEL